MGQDTLGGSCKHVEEIKVGLGVWSCTTRGVVEWKGEKGPTCAWSRGFGKM